MKSDIIRQVLHNLETIRNKNQKEEEERKVEAIRACPDIGIVLEQRKTLILDGIRKILKGEDNSDLENQMHELNNHLSELLISIKKPSDWLEPIYSCKDCKDTGYIGETIRNECHCFHEQYNRILAHDIIASYSDNASFSSFDFNLFSDETETKQRQSQRKIMKHAFDVCYRWSKAWPAEIKNTFLIIGASGLGKSYLMHCMARQMVERGLQVRLLNAFGFFEIARRCHMTNDFDEFSELLSSDVVMIDDIGSEPMMNNITVVYLYNLIDERQTMNKATVISSNLTLSELADHYSERITSRLTDHRISELILLTGEDIRRRK